MSLSLIYLFVLFSPLFISNGRAFFFELSDRTQVERCFQEEYDEGTTVAGTYRIKEFEDVNKDFKPGAIHLRVSDPEGQDMLQRQYKDQGSFAFATSTFGMYEICFMKLPSSPPVTTRVYLHYDAKGEYPLGPDDETHDNSTKLERLILAIDDQYENVLHMYHKFKKREKKFRDLSKTTNSRIIWWAAFQVIVLVLTAAWQIRHLTRFFVLKKIV